MPHKELSVLLTDDPFMARLNEQYRKKEGPTNVLAFPMAGESEESGRHGFDDQTMMGDVVVSVDTAIREAAREEEDLETTLHRLLIHGILHLIGYDHEGTLEEQERMEKEEMRLMEWIREDKGWRDYP